MKERGWIDTGAHSGVGASALLAVVARFCRAEEAFLLSEKASELAVQPYASAGQASNSDREREPDVDCDLTKLTREMVRQAISTFSAYPSQ